MSHVHRVFRRNLCNITPLSCEWTELGVACKYVLRQLLCLSFPSASLHTHELTVYNSSVSSLFYLFVTWRYTACRESISLWNNCQYGPRTEAKTMRGDSIVSFCVSPLCICIALFHHSCGKQAISEIIRKTGQSLQSHCLIPDKHWDVLGPNLSNVMIWIVQKYLITVQCCNIWMPFGSVKSPTDLKNTKKYKALESGLTSTSPNSTILKPELGLNQD